MSDWIFPSWQDLYYKNILYHFELLMMSYEDQN
jgi:hypothetical protein